MDAKSVFDFFYPNKGKTEPFHSDLGSDAGRECIQQIFY